MSVEDCEPVALGGRCGVAEYRALTGDSESSDAAIADAMDDAIDRLETCLGRPLRYGRRVESVALYGRRAYPRARPVVEVADGWRIVCAGDAVERACGCGGGCDGCQQVEYCGGYDLENMPRVLCRAILQVAVIVLAEGGNGPAAAICAQSGTASSVKTGDVAVTYRDDGVRVRTAGLPAGNSPVALICRQLRAAGFGHTLVL